MQIFYITGPSRGLGKALAKTLLDKASDNIVYGVSRSASISHRNYHHLDLDLGRYDAVKDFNFLPHPEARKITLINNAGVLGNLNHIGRQDYDAIAKVMQVNVVSLACLMDKFVATYRDTNVPRTVINISSGASKYPIDGWAAYCASKAAVDMLSEVAAKELTLEGVDQFRIVSLAPGVIDTDMQAEIRKSDSEEFYDKQTFVDYKNNRELQSTEGAAAKILSIYEKLDQISGVSLAARDF